MSGPQDLHPTVWPSRQSLSPGLEASDCTQLRLCRSEDKRSVETAPTPTSTPYLDYYEIPMPAEASEMEQRICSYLKNHNVRTSHPSIKQQIMTPLRVPSLKTFDDCKKSFLEKRVKRFSKSSRAILPDQPADSS